MYGNIKLQIDKSILRKKNTAGGIRLPDFRLYHKDSYQHSMILAQKQKHRVIEHRWKAQDRNIDREPKIESPEIHPYTHGHLIYTKEARLCDGEKTTSSINGSGKTGYLHVK